MLATGFAMGAASVLRTGIGCLELWSERMPELAQVGSESRSDHVDAAQAEASFRDQLIALARESSEIALRELRRGVYDLDAFTRPDDPPAEKPARPYKAKP
jgi:hypothetical protein